MYQRILGGEKISQFSNHGILSSLDFYLIVGLCLPGAVYLENIGDCVGRQGLSIGTPLDTPLLRLYNTLKKMFGVKRYQEMTKNEMKLNS